MLVVGLTGGIGSGKSTVAALFQELGALVIDTDQLSRQLTKPASPAFNAIIQHFGPIFLKPDGTLDRPALRHKIFKEPNERIWLEELLHPLIFKALDQQITQSLAPYCIVVIPLLTEIKPNPLIQRVLVVDATLSQQLQRTLKRDQHHSGNVPAILKTQSSREKRLQLADDIIPNTGHPKALRKYVQYLHDLYMKLSGH